ncbi:uncharacterized protein LW93_2689 [Fusarium fujikuroi]|nr:uncharacterized protein LW93_2689 [Fusarium fujikuroi]SCV32612.1 uncharacterized protein FFB14_04106 [Fusarium fujikuroi]
MPKAVKYCIPLPLDKLCGASPPREFNAQASLELDRHVAQSIPPGHPESLEDNALSQFSSDNITWKWANPRHLEADKQEYHKQENNSQTIL